MILTKVMQEIGSVLATVGLRVWAYDADKIVPPAGIVSLPRNIDYMGAYGRGLDNIDLEVAAVVGRIDARTSHAAVMPYVDGAGPKSVKQALERHQYTSCDVVVVRNGHFENLTYAGVGYLGAVFAVHVDGSGS